MDSIDTNMLELKPERSSSTETSVGRLPPLESASQPHLTAARQMLPPLKHQYDQRVHHRHAKPRERQQPYNPGVAIAPQQYINLERRSGEVTALQANIVARSKVLEAQMIAAISALPPVRDLHHAWVKKLPGTHVMLHTYAACGRVYRRSKLAPALNRWRLEAKRITGRIRELADFEPQALYLQRFLAKRASRRAAQASHRHLLARRRAAVALLTRSVRVYLFQRRTSRRRVEAARARVHGAAVAVQRIWRGFVFGRVVARVMRCRALRIALAAAGNGSMRRGLARLTASDHWQHPGAIVNETLMNSSAEDKAGNANNEAVKNSNEDESAAAIEAREAAAERAVAAKAMAMRFFNPAGGASISGSALLAMATPPLPYKDPLRRTEVSGVDVATITNSPPRFRDLPLQSETTFWRGAIARWEVERIQQRQVALAQSKAERQERSSMVVEDRASAAVRARWRSDQKRQRDEMALLEEAKARECNERVWREKRSTAAAQTKAAEAAATAAAQIVQD